MDLTQSFPRSPKNKLSGLVMVPRMLDKARAYNANTLGEYIFPCPLDKIILEYMGTDDEKIIRLVQKLGDKEIGLWIDKQCSNRSQVEKDRINNKILERKPDTQESLDYFTKIRDQIDPTHTDIVTWVDLLDLDENRIPPKIQQ